MSATHPDGRPRGRLPELDLGPPSADRSVIPGLAELQDPAPAVAVGSTLDIGPQEYQPNLQAEVDEAHDRVAELELRLARLKSKNTRHCELLIDAAESLRVSSVKSGDIVQSNLAMICYMDAWGVP